jgi:O-acetylserine/cysteine efflux transporter
MKAAHVLLAVLVAAIWGFAFVATKLGLESFSPPQLTAIRFLVAALPIFFLPRPAISLLWLIGIGLFLFTGQFLLLFFGIAQGMPPGLASITMQVQAFFTIGIAALVLRDVPTARQTAGVFVAFAGLVLIGLTIGHNLTILGLALTLGGAMSWAIGNVLVKRLGRVDMLALMVWLSIVPPLPALAISALVDEGPSLLAAVAGASWTSLGAALYLGFVATTFAYAVWGHLLRQYATALVAPFALLAPCTGVVSSALVFGERFGALRSLGMAMILIGLATTVVSPQSLTAFRAAIRRTRTSR